jgi:choline dehydrogenase
MARQDFDIIIIGAGSAGCVLANRLSADRNRRVLLVEAGGSDRHPVLRVPLLARVAYTMPSVNWGYETVPQPGLGGRSLAWPRGRVLGGSSAINGMTYIRGHARDFDTWRQLGCAGWSYADVLPYFTKSERNLTKGPPFHGTDGPLTLSPERRDDPLGDAFLQACAEYGLPPTDDFNGARQEGYGKHDYTIADGRRHSTARAFLDPVRDRGNLTVWPHCEVHRILFDGGRAIGIEGWRDGERVHARGGEIVLSGGAVNSPVLLMQSGVGDPDHLRELGIPVVAARREVGRNLQDHLGVFAAWESKRPVPLRARLRLDRAALGVVQAYLFGRGPFNSMAFRGCAFARTEPWLEIPDVQISLLPTLLDNGRWRRAARDGFLIHVYQLRPESRGAIRLRSADPRARPLIDPGYLSSPEDIACLRRGLGVVRAIAGQKALDAWRSAEITPGDPVQSDADIDRWIRASAATAFHPVGTCRMGGDDDAVVAPDLRLRGVEGLRVADASIMPRVPGGNTNAASIMIGEKAADLVRAA